MRVMKCRYEIDRERFDRLREYVTADQEFSQASTWAGIWSDDPERKAAVNLQYVQREERRRRAHAAIMLGDLEPLEAICEEVEVEDRDG